jgi:hypothetical protein
MSIRGNGGSDEDPAESEAVDNRRGSDSGPLPRSANDTVIEYASAAASMHRPWQIACVFS